MKKTLLLGAVATVAFAGAANAQSRDQIQIAGSSTVLPFANIVAEQFGQVTEFATPIVESGGSSGGLRLFCQGIGEQTIDIANSSRLINEKDIAACEAGGVTDIREIRIGYDGIVFASSVDGESFAFEPVDLYMALAAQIPVDGELQANPYTHWNDIDESFPDQEIMLFIPGENHGTREVFEEKVLAVGCEAYAEENGIDFAAIEESCIPVRKDGRSVDIAGDYTETLARIEATPTAVGVFGLSFYDQNRDRIQVATVNGIVPSLETIGSGEYPVSRPLQFYVKGEHVGIIPGLEEYVEFFLSDQVAGQQGRLVEAGLIPMSDAERQEVLDNFFNGVTVTQ
ncbi:MAG TPA: substrate-binding domain-containing protein [Alphaproteobacteria bacterium]|nr:substrate-binding domain-containing protein [Alphaproteobacteria bacterium]